MPQWNNRLLSPERALALAGNWALTATYENAELSQFENEAGRPPLEDQWQINLRCSIQKRWKFGPENAEANAELERVACGQSVAMLAAHGESFTTSVNDILAGVVRHMVMAHELALSGDTSHQPGGA